MVVPLVTGRVGWDWLWKITGVSIPKSWFTENQLINFHGSKHPNHMDWFWNGIRPILWLIGCGLEKITVRITNKTVAKAFTNHTESHFATSVNVRGTDPTKRNIIYFNTLYKCVPLFEYVFVKTSVQTVMPSYFKGHVFTINTGRYSWLKNVSTP